MSRRVFALAALLACGSLAAVPVEDIPTPRPRGWVTDQAGLLDAGAEAAIDAVASSIHAQDEAELAVVTIGSTGGEDARAYATRLFNHWGIGHAERDNGTLLFVAIDDRAAELILGDGIDDDARVAIAESIMQGEIVPRFRAGDPQGAILAGVQGVASRIYAVDAGPADASFAPAAAGAPYEYAAAAPPASSSALDDPAVRQIGGALGGGGVLGALVFGFRRWWRHRSRSCDRCGAPMAMLDEARDDAHLEPAELKEESLASVDYDLWACSACPNVTKLRYGAWFSSYAKCTKCGAKTKSSAETTLVAATYDHGGRVRVDEHCEFCGYRHSFERSTPRKTRSSSSSSGFGGGSSSGRGSSGRW